MLLSILGFNNDISLTTESVVVFVVVFIFIFVIATVLTRYVSKPKKSTSAIKTTSHNNTHVVILNNGITENAHGGNPGIPFINTLEFLKIVDIKEEPM